MATTNADTVSKRQNDIEGIAAQIVARHGDAWERGYTPEDADEVLEAINHLVQAAGLPGQMVLVWELVDGWGPGGSSDLYYVPSDGHAVHAGEAYSLVDGSKDTRPFLALLDQIALDRVKSHLWSNFPATEIADTAYQYVDARAF